MSPLRPNWYEFQPHQPFFLRFHTCLSFFLFWGLVAAVLTYATEGASESDVSSYLCLQTRLPPLVTALSKGQPCIHMFSLKAGRLITTILSVSASKQENKFSSTSV